MHPGIEPADDVRGMAAVRRPLPELFGDHIREGCFAGTPGSIDSHSEWCFGLFMVEHGRQSVGIILELEAILLNEVVLERRIGKHPYVGKAGGGCWRGRPFGCDSCARFDGFWLSCLRLTRR